MTLMNIIFLLFAGQGLFLSFLLYQQKKIKGNPWVSFYFLCYSIILMNWVIYWNEDLSLPMRSISFATPVQFLLAPLLYLSITQASRPKPYRYLHFLPAVASLLIMFPAWLPLLSSYTLPALYKQSYAMIYTTSHYISCGAMPFYMYFSWQRKQNKEHKMLIFGLAAYLFGYSTYDVLSGVGYMTAWVDYIIAFCMTVSFYAAGYHYLIQYRPNSTKSNSSGVNYEAVLLTIDRYLKGEKAFLDPDFKIEDLASGVDEPISKLSQAIATSNRSNFREYINQFRIDYAKELLQNSDYKILAVALESGYNNKVSFIQNFKKFCKMTPSEYRATARNNHENTANLKVG